MNTGSNQGSNQTSSLSISSRNTSIEENETPYILVCGAATEDNQAASKSTGCGSIVHTHAFPRLRHSSARVRVLPQNNDVDIYTSRTPSQGTVIPLEAMYFPVGSHQRDADAVRAECGCAKEGIGCSIWQVLFSFTLVSLFLMVLFYLVKSGNPLGIRYTRCKTAASSSRKSFCAVFNKAILASSHTLPSRPRHQLPNRRIRAPEGLEYWLPAPVHTDFPNNDNNNQIWYMFMASSVTAIPLSSKCEGSLTSPSGTMSSVSTDDHFEFTEEGRTLVLQVRPRSMRVRRRRRRTEQLEAEDLEFSSDL
ncbi:hypothetical protein CVT25_012521 [Psilocybe cyanescens]|uniref:Uncharacterized protein n=1 Tax=Psilocybe cyanescens TaxID=93625 RepID=A0A409VX55_PSICY|nr:hypothetical protein CVT25_012521 [Psilocybe cyanescens]